MSRRIIEGSYARLCGIRDAVAQRDNVLPRSVGRDYEYILQNLRAETDDTFTGFDLESDVYWDQNTNEATFIYRSVYAKIHQLIRYLEMVHGASNRIVEIGSLFNLIRDPELKSRCADLLSAAEHFDRSVNQATQVIEERLRSMLPDLQSDFGQVLIGKAMNGDPTKSRIVFSQTPAEQEGFVALFRGMVGAFRNPSHHRFIDEMTREQALQICAFVDNLLAALAAATTVKA